MKLTIDGKSVECLGGTKYIDLPIGSGALGISIKGATLSINAEAEGGAAARVLTYSDEEGRRIYERTLQFVMLAAVNRVMPMSKVRIEHSFGQGIYAYVKGEALSKAQIDEIRAEMRRIIASDAPITRSEHSKQEALEYFKSTHQEDKLGLLKYRLYDDFPLYEMCGMQEYFYGEMAASAGRVSVFDIKQYHPGMVLMLPDAKNPERVSEFTDMPMIARTFAQSAKWSGILGCQNAAELNEMADKQRLREFIRVNEALHERSIENIADKFAQSGAHVILIAGPSSSGKTTFAHRLMIALKVLGYRPVKVSVDDYYLNRSMAKLGPDGRPDLERLDLLDVELLNEHLLRLLQGETVNAPEFDFVSGTRKTQTHAISVEAGQPIIIEGIHCLNDELTVDVPREVKFKIYVSALTTLNLDDHNRIRSTDARLLRRIVRDYLFRGTNPETTMLGWDSVRRGEEKYIFPYQESADAMFNSTLAYEISIMKKYAYPMLRAVKQDSECYTRARRLVKFLNYFRTADVEDEIPVNSILREFIGGCCFYRDED